MILSFQQFNESFNESRLDREIINRFSTIWHNTYVASKRAFYNTVINDLKQYFDVEELPHDFDDTSVFTQGQAISKSEFYYVNINTIPFRFNTSILSFNMDKIQWLNGKQDIASIDDWLELTKQRFRSVEEFVSYMNKHKFNKKLLKVNDVTGVFENTTYKPTTSFENVHEDMMRNAKEQTRHTIMQMINQTGLTVSNFDKNNNTFYVNGIPMMFYNDYRICFWNWKIWGKSYISNGRRKPSRNSWGHKNPELFDILYFQCNVNPDTAGPNFSNAHYLHEYFHKHNLIVLSNKKLKTPASIGVFDSDDEKIGFNKRSYPF